MAKRNTNIKYFGIAAAVLLSVGGGLAPTLAASAGAQAPGIAQAATTTENSEFPKFVPTMTGTTGTSGYTQLKDGTWQAVTIAAQPITATTKTTADGPTGVNALCYYVFPKTAYTYSATGAATAAMTTNGATDTPVPASSSITTTATINMTPNTSTSSDPAATTGATTPSTQADTATPGDVSGTGDVYVVATGLTKQYPVSFYGGATSTAATITTDGQTKADATVTARATKNLQAGTLKIDQAYTATDGTNYFAFRTGGKTYFINASAVNPTAGLKVAKTSAKLTTTQDNVKTYKDPALHDYTGSLIRDKGTLVMADQQATDGSGKVIAYHISADADTGADTWVSANRVTVTENTLIRQAASGTVIANTEIPVYSDKETTTATQDILAQGQTFKYDVIVKNSIGGQTVAYGTRNSDGSYSYVKASDVTEEAAADADQKLTTLPRGTALYSNNKAATIYSDPAATKDSGTKLSTDVNEWAAFETSENSDGTIIAYRLGKNQWVKAADLATTEPLSGTFDTATGTTLYGSDGSKTGTIQNAGAYKVFAVRYIDGHQSLKLGTDNQWVRASEGAYYPA